jgi:hypothetical protein
MAAARKTKKKSVEKKPRGEGGKCPTCGRVRDPYEPKGTKKEVAAETLALSIRQLLELAVKYEADRDAPAPPEQRAARQRVARFLRTEKTLRDVVGLLLRHRDKQDAKAHEVLSALEVGELCRYVQDPSAIEYIRAHGYSLFGKRIPEVLFEAIVRSRPSAADEPENSLSRTEGARQKRATKILREAKFLGAASHETLQLVRRAYKDGEAPRGAVRTREEAVMFGGIGRPPVQDLLLHLRHVFTEDELQYAPPAGLFGTRERPTEAKAGAQPDLVQEIDDTSTSSTGVAETPVAPRSDPVPER